jgi:hypothetical protein
MLDSSDTRKGTIPGFCGNGNEPPGSVKGGEFLN